VLELIEAQLSPAPGYRGAFDVCLE